MGMGMATGAGMETAVAMAVPKAMGMEASPGMGTRGRAQPPLPAVILSRRQKRLQLLRIRQKEAKRRQSLAPPEGTYRRKPPPVKRYAGDVLAPVSPCPGGAVPVAVGPR